MFSYQKLDVYQRSIEFLAVAHGIVKKCPQGSSSVCDQLKRAALSVPLNIAEASGKVAPGDKRRYFAIARGSAMECGAIVDVCGALGLADEGELARARELLVRIAQMLTVLCRKGGNGVRARGS